MTISENGVVGTLRAQTHGHEPIVCTHAYALQGSGATSQRSNGSGVKEEECFTLNCTDVHGVAHGTQDPIVSDVAHALGRNNRQENASVKGMAVRRLTPVECERLQGFPDNYTDIKPNKKPTPEGPRYKALGNSWAVPTVRWLGQRIQDYTNRIDEQDKDFVI